MAWEYKLLFVDPTNPYELFAAGADGWEAFAVNAIGGISVMSVAWLKRPRHDDLGDQEGDPTPKQEAEFQTKRRRGRQPKGE